MRGQADALGLPILDTTGRQESVSLDELRRHAEDMLAVMAEAAAVTIRPLGAGDEQACRTCVVELQDAGREIDPRLLPGEAMADEYLQEMHRRCGKYDGTILLAERDGMIVGMVMVLAHVPYDSVDEPPGDRAVLAELVVRDGNRRRGIGTALLRAADDYARNAGATEIDINVLSRNHPARELYLREGFTPHFETLTKRLIDTGVATSQHDSK
jgi:GNAT superfamily N-acetyltransferase